MPGRESIEREQLEQRLRVMKRPRVRVSIFQGKGRVRVAGDEVLAKSPMRREDIFIHSLMPAFSWGQRGAPA